jgi:hypothetical protein
MKKLSTLIILLFLMFPTISVAKIVYCDKECYQLNNNHVATVKGLLYESAKRQDKKTRKTFSPLVAKTIIWIDKIQKEKKVQSLKDFKKDDRARLTTMAIEIIVDVVSGKTRHNVESIMIRWTKKGFRVLAEYQESVINNKTVIKYKLELRKK